MLTVFRHHISSSALLGMLADLALCFAAMLIAASSMPFSSDTTGAVFVPTASSVLLFATHFALVMALMYAFAGLYRPTPISWAASLRRTLFALISGSLLTYVSLGALADRHYAWQLISSALVYLLVGLVFVRGTTYFARKISAVPRVLVIGTGEEAQAVALELKATRRVARSLVGFYAPVEDATTQVQETEGVKVFGRNQQIVDLVAEHNIEEIVVAVREQRGGAVPMDQLLACRIRGVRVLDLAGFYERTKSEVPIDSLKGSWLVYGHGFVQGKIQEVAKRAFDIVSSSLLLVLASPIMLITMLAIKLDSPGPMLYSQERVGLGGSRFKCLKFRSMRTDAEKDGVARWAAKNDSRITRVGQFIRKTRIDELPQLVSVLRGEMSMVGPRPERPSFVEQLREQIPFYDIRHSIKPGVTGWAQVRYSYGASLDDAKRKHQFDLYYVKNNSLFLDLLILIETVSVVLFREGQ
jgi:sugar transferase (PEP-CTERM system associated)